MSFLEDTRQIVDTVFGALAAEVLFTAARLGVADSLGESECTAADLAATYNADVVSFTRFLRAMAAMGLLTETESCQFRATSAGNLLRTDHPASLRAFVQMFGDPAMLGAWREFETSVRTGETTFKKVYGTSIFEYLGKRPELSATFNAAMRQGTTMIAQILPNSYDFTRFRTVADLGGGDGTLLAAVLAANPHLSGILFDSAEGLAQADATFDASGVADRATSIIGNFFDSAPSGADLYLLKSVIHDWNDEQCATILSHVRQVIPECGRLLIIEPVVPDIVDGAVPLMTYLSDLNMMVNTGGRERTFDEFQELCATGGLPPRQRDKTSARRILLVAGGEPHWLRRIREVTSAASPSPSEENCTSRTRDSASKTGGTALCNNAFELTHPIWRDGVRGARAGITDGLPLNAPAGSVVVVI